MADLIRRNAPAYFYPGNFVSRLNRAPSFIFFIATGGITSYACPGKIPPFLLQFQPQLCYKSDCCLRDERARPRSRVPRGAIYRTFALIRSRDHIAGR